MTPGLEVLDGGLQTTVQDFGRHGLLALGVPRGGALDSVSLRLANLLVGNGENAAALECRSPAPTLLVEAPHLRLALAGTGAALIVERAGVSTTWASWRAVDVRAGDMVRVEPFADTAVAYLAVAGGGVNVKPELGSRSTSIPGGFGGGFGRALAAGDRLPVFAQPPHAGPCFALLRPPSWASGVLRILEGPQLGRFTAEALRRLTEETFTVSRDLDRMGVRLDGPQLQTGRGGGITSDPNIAGALQVPPSGLPVLLLADCGTTGGYPKIGVVISADLPAAGRLRAGSAVSFRWVDLPEAELARRNAQDEFLRAARLVAVREFSGS